MRLIRIIFKLDARTILLFGEAYIYLGWSRLLVRLRPFSKLAPKLGLYMHETQSESAGNNRLELTQVRSAIHIMSRHTFWQSKCLVRAIAASKMLERRRIDSTLYLGTAKDEAGRMIAHAWLRSGPLYITGAEEMGKFTVTGKFAKVVQYEGKKEIKR